MPDKENYSPFKKYTSSFKINRDTNIFATAIADKKLESNINFEYFRIGYSKNGFYCDEDGIINWFIPDEYNGDLNNIIVPNDIEDIKPISFVDRDYEQFFYPELESIILPDSMTTISRNCFFSSNIKKIIGNGMKNISPYAFQYCHNLSDITFGQIEEIGEYAFDSCPLIKDFSTFKDVVCVGENAFTLCSFENIYAPNLTEIGAYSFSSIDNLHTVDMPALTVVGQGAFQNNANLEKASFNSLELLSSYMFADDYKLSDIYIPNCKDVLPKAKGTFRNTLLKSITLNSKSLPEKIFEGCYLDYAYFPEMEQYYAESNIKRIEFEKLQNLRLVNKYSPDIISVPSSCNNILINGTNERIIIYGTDETYISQWCKENNMNFKTISQETAIITDLPDEISDLNTTLIADVIGFNRTYQWYANTEADNTTGIAIEGATDKTFTPSEYPQADYYYCVVTSIDVGYEPVTIRTGTTKYSALEYKVKALGRSICCSAAGVRFGFTWDNIDEIESLASDIEYGFIYSQKGAENLSIDTVDNKSIKKTVANNRVNHGDTTSFNLVIANIPKDYYDREITARAYVCIDGMYFYSNVLKGSFSEVSNLVLADDEIDQATKDRVQNLLSKEV